MVLEAPQMCLRKEKVGVPDHLFFSSIAGPAGRRDPATVTQIKYNHILLSHSCLRNDIVLRMPPREKNTIA